MFLDKYFGVKDKTEKAVITGGEIVGIYYGFKFLKNEVTYWKSQRELNRQQGQYGGNPTVYGLPGYGAVTPTSPITPYAAAKNIFDYYNADGENTDEIGMFKEMMNVPPSQFGPVAAEYGKLGRNLMNDMDEQMKGEIFENIWKTYKQQIVL